MKIVLPIIVGYLAWTALWLGGNIVLQSIYAESISSEGVISDVPPLLWALGLSIACSLLAGLVAAVMAKENKSKAVWIMAALLLATGIGVQVGTVWDKMPLWFHLTFLALIVPCCLVGGKLPKT